MEDNTIFEIIESYLEDEVRDGFYIPSIAKRAWAAELSILHEINRICEKYSIRYVAEWGSILGAIRHQGFVPWDDDLDIGMFRSDLNRFIEVAPRELSAGYKIHSFMNNDYSWKFVINVVNTERMCFEPEYLKSHLNFPYIATIDIFVLDNVYDDEDKEQERRDKIKSILSVADMLTEDNCHRSDTIIKLSEVERISGREIIKTLEYVEIKRQLFKIVQDIVSEYKNDESEYVVQQFPSGIYHKLKYKRELFEGVIKLPFEDTYICVPKLYDRILRNKYGNYWEIRMGVGGHGYPYYNAQKAELGLPEDADYILHYKFNKTLIETVGGRTAIGGLDARFDTISSIEGFKNSPDYSGEFDRETVLFLPFKGDYWDSMKPFYEEESSKDNTDVFVVPLPYYYKEYNGALRDEAQYDLGKYPEELPIYLIDQLDLSTMFPDRIYIQNPYDEYNMCMSVPPEYYASKIRNLTKKLIYVPWFETSDFEKENYPSYYNMQYYCTVPGVVLADEVIVNTQTIKERYMDKLCDFAGDETRSIWDEKITVGGECSVGSSSDDTEHKKTMLFYTSPSTILEYGEKYIDKLNRCIDIFKDNSDKISVIWHFDKGEMDIISEYDRALYQKIKSIRDSLSANGTIIADGDLSEKEIVIKCNAYYGDPSHIAKDFFMKKKPVMISNVEI